MYQYMFLQEQCKMIDNPGNHDEIQGWGGERGLEKISNKPCGYYEVYK